MKRPCAHAPACVERIHAASAGHELTWRTSAIGSSFIKHPPCCECAVAGPLGNRSGVHPPQPD
ncbi:hypothetical protein GCM10018953_58450 [Streptosporangium nondiastaticum]